jgi:hypothetical protein
MRQPGRWHLIGVVVGLGLFLVSYALGGHTPRGDTISSGRPAAGAQYSRSE